MNKEAIERRKQELEMEFNQLQETIRNASERLQQVRGAYTELENLSKEIESSEENTQEMPEENKE